MLANAQNIRSIVIWTILVLSTAALLAILFMSYQGTKTYLHPPRFQRQSGDDPGAYGVPFQEVRITTKDGIELSAWYTPPENGVVILAAHGYGSARSAELHALFSQHGFGALSWDARAHGESGGSECTWGYLEVNDVLAMVDFAKQQENVRRLGGYGASMGGVTMIKAAARDDRLEAVAADSAFPTIDEMTGRIVRWGILIPFMKAMIKLETGASAQDIRPIDDIGSISPRPVLVIQGGDDTVIPADSAQRLFEAAGEPRYLWVQPGVGHVGLFSEYPDEFDERVIGFFDKELVDQ